MTCPAARQTVIMYKKLSGVADLRKASTPCCPEGTLAPADDEIEGEVARHACALIMKQLWLARLARPNLIKAIWDFASRVYE